MLVFKELRHHAPFTFMGALTGIVLALVLRGISEKTTYMLFYTFHPLHVFLSAFVTASLYRLHTKDDKNFLKFFLIGYIGSVGIATLSDSVIPYIGEALLKMPNPEMHLGFIEEWYVVNPIAILGIILARFFPSTKLPHFGHILVSTWASLFHVMMAMGGVGSLYMYSMVLMLLFIAVWIPCCVSDIVFPMLFIPDVNVELIHHHHHDDAK